MTDIDVLQTASDLVLGGREGGMVRGVGGGRVDGMTECCE